MTPRPEINDSLAGLQLRSGCDAKPRARDLKQLAGIQGAAARVLRGQILTRVRYALHQELGWSIEELRLGSLA